MAIDPAVCLAFHIIPQFPSLDIAVIDPTSDEDGTYNCVAWAAGETHRKWGPGWQRFKPVLPLARDSGYGTDQ